MGGDLVLYGVGGEVCYFFYIVCFGCVGSWWWMIRNGKNG